ncbi:hypothetical protein [Peribacillus butanolivorans]|nr:hypothetical protein [Peribacillus butanolivorans]
MNKKEVLEVWIDKYTQSLVRLAYTIVKDWLRTEDHVRGIYLSF